LLYESCLAGGRPDRFQQIEAATHSLELIALVVMMAIGGVLVETTGFTAAWIAETVLAASGVAIALRWRHPPPRTRANLNAVGELRPAVRLPACSV
jgi:hypothetical protein